MHQATALLARWFVHGAGKHLIKVGLVGNDIVVLLLDGLQMCNNGISQIALELAPSHVPHLFKESVLQAR